MKKPIQVLIIEDNLDDAKMEIDELISGGFDIVYEIIETRKAMREALKNKTWDCIISDFSLPQFSGLDALAELKETGMDIPFILISGNIGEDVVTFSATVAASIRPGDKITLNAVAYEVKYFLPGGGGNTIVVLTSVLVAGLAAVAAKVKDKYTMVTIEFNDVSNTPTSNSVANKSVIILVPTIDAAGTFNSIGAAATQLKAILNGWMATVPRVFAAQAF